MINKNLFLLSLFFINNIFGNETKLHVQSKHDPLLVVVIMIKNEEKVINATLDPYVKAGVDSFLVLDTGSTDNTIATVRDFFEKNKVKSGYIVQEPFVDFAISRNKALEFAEQKFPNATFFLMPDAEWYMHNVKGLLDFCELNKNDITHAAYLIRIFNPKIDFYHVRLLRNNFNVRFVGAVHEVPNAITKIKVPREVYFELGSSKFGLEKSTKRWERDREILLKKVQQDPNDTRSLFYLAQTFECLGDLKNSHKYYEIRSTKKGWDEEDYETFYRLARVIEELSKSDKNFTWHQAYENYTTAFKMRPHRAEPLLKIAEHYWPDNKALCYVFARRTLDLPYPKNEFLFVDKEVYDFSRYEVISKSAWYAGDVEAGEIATRAALNSRPDIAQLYRNLATYMEARQVIRQQQQCEAKN